MKKTIILCVCMAALMVKAAPVSLQEAKAIAGYYFTAVEDITPHGWDEVYVLQPVEGTGFVVVSADDCTVPVLAYSPTQRFDTLAMPEHVVSWFEGYRREVASLRKAGAVASKEVAKLWHSLNGATKSGAVGPLMTTEWSQSPYYNNMCPFGGDGSRRVVTGCVATATAQVMKYWNHPSVGHGSHTYTASGIGTLSVAFDTAYDWNNMSNKLSRRSSSAQVRAVARLMYHVGVAVSMKYGVSSSGAQVLGSGPSSESALKNYFRYSPSLHGLTKSKYRDAAWDSIIKHEIDQRRPVLYTGFDASGGHAFVVDGYQRNNGRYYFHINWGWSGSYDGYYTLDSLSPGGGGTGGNSTYTFNMGNEAVVGIRPSGASQGMDVSVVETVVDNPRTGTVSGGGTYATYQDRVTLTAVPAEGYRFDHWSSGALENPQIFTVNGDFTDTAYFVPIGIDTIGYSRNLLHSTWYDNSRTMTEWGIRISADLRQHQRGLKAVSLFVFAGGEYTINIHIGDTVNASTLVHRQRFYEMSLNDWVTIDLDSVVYVDNYRPLWITFSYRDGGYPAARSAYGGYTDGAWCKKGGRWYVMNDGQRSYSWMIRGVFVERQQRTFTVGLSTAMNDSSQVPPSCNATGAGTYVEDSLVSLMATSDSHHEFLYWLGVNGDTVRDNPYCYHPSADNFYTAVFRYKRLGIEGVQWERPKITITGRDISVQCPSAQQMWLFDSQGRQLPTTDSHGMLQARVSAAGVYILMVDGLPWKIVVP